MKLRVCTLYRGAASRLLLAGALSIALTLSSSGLAQRRGPGDRTGGGSPPRRESPPPAREEPPKRESAPPTRTDPAPRRDVSPPAPDPAPRRDVAPPPDPTPRREIGDRSGPGDRTGPTRRESAPPPDGDRAPTTAPRRGGDDRAGPAPDRPAGPDDPGRLPGTRYAPQPTRDRGGNGSRPTDPSPAPSRDRALDLFTRSAEGRRYQNGIALRPGAYVPREPVRHYFDSGWSFYPYYGPSYEAGEVYRSPYGYFGSVPPYIYRAHTYYRPPTVVYVEVPVYRNRVSVGFRDDDSDYYLADPDYLYEQERVDPDVRRALDDLEEAFERANIGLLVPLTDPAVRIAVLEGGAYQYTLSASDYLDMTRDMLRNVDTVEFHLTRVRRRASGVYVASGRHVYRTGSGVRRTVYVSFALERVLGRWVITQVGYAPERLDDR
ncbi:MAG: hypothetical protein IT208_02585 [Chthonomonadales bacterium]|nr:hypothetical protein [Chthonomonadales bacterium]